MIERSPSPLFLGESPGAVPIPHAAPRALAAVGAMLTAALLAASVVVGGGGGEAGRIAAAHADGYGAALVSALAASLAKPLR